MRVDERNTMLLKNLIPIFLGSKSCSQKTLPDDNAVFSSSDLEGSISDLEIEPGTVRLGRSQGIAWWLW